MIVLNPQGRRIDAVRYDPESQSTECQQVCALDPLSADHTISLVPQLNASKDVRGLIQLLRSLVPDTAPLLKYSRQQAMAATRDLGIFLGSIKRHGVEPVVEIPELAPVLIRLGELSDFPPRDTLIHCTSYNPDGPRRRLYTIHVDEQHLVSGTKIAMPHIESAIDKLMCLFDLPFASPEFAAMADDVQKEIEGVIDGLLFVAKNVSRKIFAEELRLYFDPILINGKPYLGPGAVEMPIFILDHLLWSSRIGDREYDDFKRGFVPYIQPWLRSVFLSVDGQPSILSRAAAELASAPDDVHVALSATHTLKMMNTLLKFRMPHKRLADEAYAAGQPHLPQRAQGSGGYPTTILDKIIALTVEARNEWRSHISAYLSRVQTSSDRPLHPPATGVVVALEQAIRG